MDRSGAPAMGTMLPQNQVGPVMGRACALPIAANRSVLVETQGPQRGPWAPGQRPAAQVRLDRGSWGKTLNTVQYCNTIYQGSSQNRDLFLRPETAYSQPKL